MQFRVGTQILTVNIATKSDLLQQVSARFVSNKGFALATINLDHLAKLPASKTFQAAYAAQDFIVADGNPVVWLSKLANKPVNLMPGSDLIVPLAELAAQSGIEIALIGSSEETLENAASHLCNKVPNLVISLKNAPPQGFDPEGETAAEILHQLEASGARLCFLALGAQKQEIFAARGRETCANIGFVSIGAGLDFLAGSQTRAPMWMRKLALEWLWRLLNNPVRLLPRYVQSVSILPKQIIAALRQR